MAPPLYPKMVSTPSSASTCTIMSAPFMVAPASGCCWAAGSAGLSFEDDIGSPSGDLAYTPQPALLSNSPGRAGGRLLHYAQVVLVAAALEPFRDYHSPL